MIALDKDRVLESLGGDQELLWDVLGILLNELPRHMASLQEAIWSGDAGAIEHLAHSIKGELGYLSLAEVSRSARDIEASGRDGDIALAASLYTALQVGVSEVLPLCADWLGSETQRTQA
jgi:HPt (histidine-containing phosphotransfer) domain-containing protein